MGLIRRLCVEQGAGTDKLTEKLSENLKEILADNKVRVCNVHYDMNHLHRDTSADGPRSWPFFPRSHPC